MLAQINESTTRNTVFLGFVDDNPSIQSAFSLLGNTNEIKNIIEKKEATDVIIALPYSAYPQLSMIVQQMEDCL